MPSPDATCSGRSNTTASPGEGGALSFVRSSPAYGETRWDHDADPSSGKAVLHWRGRPYDIHVDDEHRVQCRALDGAFVCKASLSASQWLAALRCRRLAAKVEAEGGDPALWSGFALTEEIKIFQALITAEALERVLAGAPQALSGMPVPRRRETVKAAMRLWRPRPFAAFSYASAGDREALRAAVWEGLVAGRDDEWLARASRRAKDRVRRGKVVLAARSGGGAAHFLSRLAGDLDWWPAAYPGEAAAAAGWHAVKLHSRSGAAAWAGANATDGRWCAVHDHFLSESRQDAALARLFLA